MLSHTMKSRPSEIYGLRLPTRSIMVSIEKSCSFVTTDIVVKQVEWDIIMQNKPMGVKENINVASLAFCLLISQLLLSVKQLIAGDRIVVKICA